MSSFFEATLGQWELLLRVVIAAVAGASIGLERSHRHKEAGLRTHIILALGAALIMLVSKYGFADSFNADVTRIASNVVTGVGFLGAGVIFVRGSTVKGLTTAAGIFATAGIGLAIGAGMYTLGIFCTVLIVLLQLCLHKFIPATEAAEVFEVTLVLESGQENHQQIRKNLEELGILITSTKATRSPEGRLTLRLAIRIPGNLSPDDLISHLYNDETVSEFSLHS